MRYRGVGVAAAAAILATGCTTVPVVPQPLPPAPPPLACNAAGAGWALGERASAGVLERATIDSGARSARVIEPGEVVTMEFSPDRLTILVNGRNRITDLRCG